MDSTSVPSRIWNLLRKPAISLTLRVAISGLLLLYLARLSAFTGMAQAFRRIQPLYLLAFFLLYFASVSLQSLRWAYLLKTWDVSRKFHVLFRSIMTALFLNNFLPGSLGGDVYRLYAGGRGTGKVEAVGATIFYERLLGYGSLVTLGLIALSIRADPARDWVFWLLLGGALLGLLVLSSLPSVSWFGRLAQALMERSSLARKLRLTDWLTSFRFKVRHPGILAGLLVMSFLIQFMDLFSFWLVAAALQLPVRLEDLLLFVPLLYLAILLPVSFNGVGVRETLFVLFSSMWGISSANAIAFSLTVFTLGLAGSLVGGVLYWFASPTPGHEAGKSRFPG
jgi:hypothetical protein